MENAAFYKNLMVTILLPHEHMNDHHVETKLATPTFTV